MNLELRYTTRLAAGVATLASVALSPPAIGQSADAGTSASSATSVAVGSAAAETSANGTSAAETSLDATDRGVPTFELDLLEGGVIDTAALAGKPWLINFWATWCAPCVEEIPAMNIAWEALEPAGVGMLAINVGEPSGAIDAFMQKVPIDFPVALGNGATTLPNWGARALPTTLLVDRHGKVVQEALGPREWDDAELIARIAALADE